MIATSFDRRSDVPRGRERIGAFRAEQSAARRLN
jgi:hypothetical protein